jgi:hypothetical protein
MANSAETLSALLIYEMIYLFTAIGFPPCSSGQQTCTSILVGKRHLYTKGETIQKCRIHKKRKQKCVVLASLS